MSIEHRESRQKLDRATQSLINAANREASRWVDKGSAALKAERAIESRFRPYVEENNIIAAGLSSREYVEHVIESQNELKTRAGIVLCSDGRLLTSFYVPPRYAGAYRKPGGLPELHDSQFNNNRELGDPTLKGAIASNIKQDISEGQQTQVFEMVGSHIDSVHPTSHGCGALGLQIQHEGRYLHDGMKHGAISDYFNILGNGFYSFDKIAENAGGKGNTFSTFQDTHSMGLLFGIRESVYDESSGKILFQESKSLRENLIALHNDKKILASEFVDDIFKDSIRKRADNKGINRILDMRNPDDFAHNMRLVSEIALDITKNLNRDVGFDWIPRSLIEGKSQDVINTLAYLTIRNCTIRQLGGITPGKHNLIEHPEQLFRVGSIGAEFNVKTVPFIEATPEGEIRQKDIDALKQLYGLSTQIFPKMGINLSNEGRLIVVTGSFDREIYSNEIDARTKFETIASTVRGNAREIRNVFAPAVKKGDVVVIPALYRPKDRELTHVLEPNASL